MANVKRIRDCRVFSPKWSIYSASLLPRFREHCRRSDGKHTKARANDYKETVSSEYSRAAIHMNVQWLGCHAEDLHNLKPGQIAQRGKFLIESILDEEPSASVS